MAHVLWGCCTVTCCSGLGQYRVLLKLLLNPTPDRLKPQVGYNLEALQLWVLKTLIPTPTLKST